MRELIVGIDLGGTQIRALLYDPEQGIIGRAAQLTHAAEGLDAVVERINETTRQAVGDAPWERIRGIGVGVPGPTDARRGVIVKGPNLPGWVNVPLRDMLTDVFGKPIALGNDANLAALGEQRFGAGQGFEDLIYITVSTGIGGGIISDGHLLLGANGLAGEVGHQTILPNGPLCGCGNHGCLEAVASGTAIGREGREMAATPRGTAILAAAGGEIDRVDARAVGQAAESGDPAALEIVHQAATYLGIGLANLCNILNPRTLVLGGGVTHLGDLLFDTVRQTVAQRAMPGVRDVLIVPAALGGDVVLYGAVALVDREIH